MSELMQGAQHVEFPETLTDGVLSSFQDEEQRELDFKEFMLGEQHALGGRHDMDSRGLSTDNVTAREDALISPFTPTPLPTEADYVQPLATPQPVETNWQQEYGKSENEKGELRSQLKAVMDKNTQLESLQQAAAVQLPTFFDTPQALPPQNAAQPVNPQPQFDPALVPRLVDKADGEPMFAEDVDNLMRTKVAPYMFGLQQQLDQAQANTAQANQRLFDSEKARLGIDPQTERVLVAQNPWLSGMREPGAYIQALGQIKARNDAAAQVQATAAPAPAAPTPAITPGQRAEVRRRTFVETSSQAAGPAQANSATLDPNAIFMQEWQKTLSLPYEKKAAAQRALMKSRGAMTVSGYRDPSVLTS